MTVEAAALPAGKDDPSEHPDEVPHEEVEERSEGSSGLTGRGTEGGSNRQLRRHPMSQGAAEIKLGPPLPCITQAPSRGESFSCCALESFPSHLLPDADAREHCLVAQHPPHVGAQGLGGVPQLERRVVGSHLQRE